MKRISLSFLMLGSMVAFGCGDNITPPPELGEVPMLVSAAWLAEHRDHPDVQIVDVREQGLYDVSHIPGAIQFDLADVRATIDGIPGMVAPPETVEDVLSAAGLRPDATIVLYDDSDGLYATRLLWTFHYYNHFNVHLLHGGLQVWEEEGGAVTTKATTYEPTTFTIDETRDELRVTADWIFPRLEDPSIVLVDARSIEEWQAGYIPGAFHHDWHNNVENHLFKPDSVLLEMYSIPKDKTVVAYCQTGTRASVTYFTLLMLGYPDVKVYDGSWGEWSIREDLPKTIPPAQE
jgi:thiosulfate/3-mercaptopyruvate sulfurtransferase